MRTALPNGIVEFVMFTLKQGWAALFGGLLLLAVIFTNAIWGDDWGVARYDALFAFAISVQAAMLLLKLETLREAKVIALFHLTGTAMEFFKVSAGSWAYPEDAMFMILGVPMFSGFMYASVGSYIARVIRIFDMTFAPYPPFWVTVIVASAIYVNFFTHHFGPDIRLGLFAATVVIFGRTASRRVSGELFPMGCRKHWHVNRHMGLCGISRIRLGVFVQNGQLVPAALRQLRHSHSGHPRPVDQRYPRHTKKPIKAATTKIKLKLTTPKVPKIRVLRRSFGSIVSRYEISAL